VDSTLAAIEGIDFLAGGNDEVVNLTNLAMNGELSIDEVYGKRLDLIRPSISDLERLAGEYKSHLLPDAAEVVSTLQGA